MCKTKKPKATMFTDTDEEADEALLHAIRCRKQKAITVTPVINNIPVRMEVDTGAAVSIISEKTWRHSYPDTNWRPSSVILKSYSGEKLSVCGETDVTVTYKKETVQLPILIVSGSGPALLGRDWLYTLKLD